MAQQAEVLNLNANSNTAAAAQPGWWSRNKNWAAPTAAFAGGVAVGVGAVKAYDYLTGSDDVAAPAQAKTATK